MSITMNKNYLSPTNFKITIDLANYRNLEYFVQSFNHPSVTIPSAELAYKRTNAFFAGDKLDYGELSVQILVDEDMEVYDELYNWAERLVNEEQINTQTDNCIGTFADITLNILSSKNNINRTIRYKECVLTNIGDLSFDVNAGGDSFITCNASFRFTTFEME